MEAILKKILKAIGILLVLIMVALLAIPYFFHDQIKEKIEKAINEKVDAKVSFSDVNLSLFKSFPQANVRISKMAIINKAPFLGDTLVSFDELNLKMSIKELFNDSDKPLNIEAISTRNGLINIIFNENGIGNYDIALKEEAKKSDSKSKPLNLKIKDYNIDNYQFRFTDKKSKLKMVLDSINHEGEGDFAKDVLDLATTTTAKVSLDMDKVNYMKNVKLSLDAVLGIDLKNSKYTFKQNKAKINELPLEFN